MAWWVAAAQLAATAYDSYQGTKAQGKANRINRQMRDRYNTMFDRYDQYYAPSEQYMADQMSQGPDLEGAAAQGRADFNDSYELQQAGLQREMQQYGINPGSQRYLNAMEDSHYQQAAGSAITANMARQQESDADWARRVSWVNQGNNIQANAINGMNGQAAGLQNSANSYMDSAGAGLQALGQFYGGQQGGNAPNTVNTAGLSQNGGYYPTGAGRQSPFMRGGR